MIKNYLLIFLSLFLGEIAFSQTFSTPESIIYDSVGNRYFVSNIGSKNIVELSTSNETSEFVNLNGREPKGLAIVGDTLICITNHYIEGYLLSDASQVVFHNVEGSVFLNDVTADGKGNIYVSDMQANEILVYDLSADTISVVTESISSPNGVLFHEPTNTVLVCNWGSNAKIQAINLSDNSVNLKVQTKFKDLDGLAMDNCGNIYVSSWGNSGIYVYDPLFENIPTKLVAAFNSPADISINQMSQTLLIPSFNGNKVEFIELGMGCEEELSLTSPANNSENLTNPIALEWSLINEASAYELEYGTDSTFHTKTVKLKIYGNDTTLNDLDLETRYFWRVRALGTNNKSIFSNVWNFTTTTKVGIEENKVQNLVYPNPCNNVLNFKVPVKGVRVYNALGKIVIHKSAELTQIDISKQNAGIYLVEYINSDGSFSQKTIIKE